MSDDEARTSDRELLEALSAALTEQGELLPTDENEVMRAEERGAEEVPLPAQLREPSFEDRGAEERTARKRRGASAEAPVDLGAYRARRAILSHALSLGVGAAAAAALMFWLRGDAGDAPEPPLGGDARGTTTSSAPQKLPLSLPKKACTACCAGSECATAGELQSCPSGRSCIPCDSAALMGSRYRLRVGAVAPAELGHKTLAIYPHGEPEICLRAGVSSEVCVPTRITDSQRGNWNVLPMVVTAEDLAAKLAMRLRWKGVEGPKGTAAHWVMPVALTPRSLCNGYVVKLVDDNEEVFGVMSLFMDDTHYVELMRAGDTQALRDHRDHFETSGVSLVLQETSEEGAQRFVLTAGPFDLHDAEALRWQLLELQQPAVTTVGSDYLGTPKPLP